MGRATGTAFTPKNNAITIGPFELSTVAFADIGQPYGVALRIERKIPNGHWVSIDPGHIDAKDKTLADQLKQVVNCRIGQQESLTYNVSVTEGQEFTKKPLQWFEGGEFLVAQYDGIKYRIHVGPNEAGAYAAYEGAIRGVLQHFSDKRADSFAE